MTAFHVFYIPAVLSLGVAIGIQIGRRSAYREAAMRDREERDRAERRAQRERAESHH